MNYSYTFFSTNNLPNTTQQGKKKHNCYSLYNICHCTASAVLSEGHCAIFRFCHVRLPLESGARIREFGFHCQLSHIFAVRNQTSHLASLGLREGCIRWPGVAFPFLVWNSVIALTKLLPPWWWLWVKRGRRCSRDTSLQNPLLVFKRPWPNAFGKEEKDRFVSESWLWVGVCLCVHLDTFHPPPNYNNVLLNEYLNLKHICSVLIYILGVC